MTVNRCVEVIDSSGRTADGGLVLNKACLEVLRKLLAWRGHSNLLGEPMVAKYAIELGDVICREQGLSFAEYT